MRRKFGSENGFAYLLVIFMLIVISVTVIVIATALATQSNVAGTANNCSVALAKAEAGIEVGYARLRANGDLYGTTTFNDGNWTITVSYPVNGTTNHLRSTARLGRYQRTVEVEINTTQDPLLQYAFASGGTIKIDNGGYDLKSNNVYAKNDIIITDQAGSIHSSTGDANLYAGHQVMKPSWADLPANHILPHDHSVDVNIPDVNWQALRNDATVVHDNVTGDLDISSDLLNAHDKVIYIRVTGGNPTIYTTGQDFSNCDATIVIVKGNSSVNPTLEFRNGTYGSLTQNKIMKLNAFVQGKVNMTGLEFVTSGVFYSTDKITMQNGTYNITGGVACKSDIDIYSASFAIPKPNWAVWDPYMFLQAVSKSNWREI